MLAICMVLKFSKLFRGTICRVTNITSYIPAYKRSFQLALKESSLSADPSPTGSAFHNDYQAAAADSYSVLAEIHNAKDLWY